MVRWSGLPAAPEFRFEFQDPGHCRVGSEFPAFSRVREVHVSDDVLPGIRVMPTQLSVFPPHAQVQHGAVTLQDPALDGSNGNGLVLSACQPVSGQSGPVGQAVLYYKPLSEWFPFRSSSKKSSSQVWLALPPVPPFPLPVTVDPKQAAHVIVTVWKRAQDSSEVEPPTHIAMNSLGLASGAYTAAIPVTRPVHPP